MIINFEEYFKTAEKEIYLNQKRILLNSKISVYFGITSEKNLRLSFMSSIESNFIESTKFIKVIQGKEKDNVYWTCFDLIKDDVKDVFYNFCSSLVNSIENVNDEREELKIIKNKFYAWKSLFKNKGRISNELYQGLYGELYFLYYILMTKYPIEKAISIWTGPDGYSKDFSLDETWYEIKTIQSNSNSVKINSITQLDSNVDGHLVVIYVEKMSKEFNSECDNVHKLYNLIIDKIQNLEIKNEFINKTISYGYIDDELNNLNSFEVKKMNYYNVGEKFPRFTTKNLPSSALCNVKYEIVISAINEFLEDK